VIGGVAVGGGVGVGVLPGGGVLVGVERGVLVGVGVADIDGSEAARS